MKILFKLTSREKFLLHCLNIIIPIITFKNYTFFYKNKQNQGFCSYKIVLVKKELELSSIDLLAHQLTGFDEVQLFVERYFRADYNSRCHKNDISDLKNMKNEAVSLCL